MRQLYPMLEPTRSTLCFNWIDQTADTHCGIRNSSDIFMEYQEKFYRDVFFPYLNDNGIKRVLHLGDYYDNRKTVNFKCLNHNRKIFLEKLREYGITMDIILGNHDTYFKNTNELNSLKELQGHYMNEVNIVDKPTVMNYDGLNIGLLPWIAEDNEEESLEFINNCNASILGSHLELQGFDMSKGMPCMDGMSRQPFEKFEMVLTGHFHAKSTQGNIHYLGAHKWNSFGMIVTTLSIFIFLIRKQENLHRYKIHIEFMRRYIMTTKR